VPRGKCEQRRARNAKGTCSPRKSASARYQAALAKCAQSWELYAWFYYRVRGFYRPQAPVLTVRTITRKEFDGSQQAWEQLLSAYAAGDCDDVEEAALAS